LSPRARRGNRRGDRADLVELDAHAGSIAAVASVAEESSASTEQVSASTEQTSASAEEVAASATELASTAEDLKRLVAQFTLD
jgi:methyl-accepting chemotaxis protein